MTLRDVAPQGAAAQFAFAALSFGALADARQAVGKDAEGLRQLN
jgi:hypothetical protein